MNDYAEIPVRVIAVTAAALAAVIVVLAVLLAIAIISRRRGASRVVLVCVSAVALVATLAFALAVASVRVGVGAVLPGEKYAALALFDGKIAVPCVGEAVLPVASSLLPECLAYAAPVLALVDLVASALCRRERKDETAVGPASEEGDGYYTVKAENRPFMSEPERAPAPAASPEVSVSDKENDAASESTAPAPAANVAPEPAESVPNATPAPTANVAPAAPTEKTDKPTADPAVSENQSPVEGQETAPTEEAKPSPVVSAPVADGKSSVAESAPAEKADDAVAVGPRGSNFAEKNAEPAAEEQGGKPTERAETEVGSPAPESERPSASERYVFVPQPLPVRRGGKKRPRAVTDSASEAFEAYYAGMSADERAALAESVGRGVKSGDHGRGGEGK